MTVARAADNLILSCAGTARMQGLSLLISQALTVCFVPIKFLNQEHQSLTHSLKLSSITSSAMASSFMGNTTALQAKVPFSSTRGQVCRNIAYAQSGLTERSDRVGYQLITALDRSVSCLRSALS